MALQALSPTTIRARFALTAGFAFLVMIGSGIAHLAASHLAETTAAQARDSQVRTEIYVGLQQRSSELFTSTASPDHRDSLGVPFDESRAAFGRLLADADRLSQRPGSSARAGREIQVAGRSLMAFVDDRAAFQTALRVAIEAGVRRGRGQIDTQAFRSAIDSAFVPFTRFDRLAQREIALDSLDEAKALRKAGSAATRLAIFSVISLIAGVALMASTSLLFLSRLNRALDILLAGTVSVAKGDFTRGFDVKGNDELTRLAEALNAMTEQLAQKQSALDRAHLECEDEVRRRTADLAAANRQLALGDERRRAFLADVSHELRTPLTIIRGESQVWLRYAEGEAGDPAPVFGRILDHVGVMARLVEDLLIIARAEGGGLSLRIADLDLQALTRRVVEDFTALAQERNCVIRVSSEGPLVVEADEDRVRQVLLILLDNATQHAGSGCVVTIRLTPATGAVHLTIIDDGPGVPEPLRERIFLRFSRGGASRGAGLGLAVAKALAVAHDGDLTLQPSPDGRGACFELRLPAPGPATSAALA